MANSFWTKLFQLFLYVAVVIHEKHLERTIFFFSKSLSLSEPVPSREGRGECGGRSGYPSDLYMEEGTQSKNVY